MIAASGSDGRSRPRRDPILPEAALGTAALFHLPGILFCPLAYLLLALLGRPYSVRHDGSIDWTTVVTEAGLFAAWHIWSFVFPTIAWIVMRVLAENPTWRWADTHLRQASIMMWAGPVFAVVFPAMMLAELVTGTLELVGLAISNRATTTFASLMILLAVVTTAVKMTRVMARVELRAVGQPD